MADLRFKRPAATEGFTALLSRIAPLPWTIGGETGVLLDAKGQACAAIDPSGERPDDVANAIAALVMIAVNTCGGFACAAPAKTDPTSFLRREYRCDEHGVSIKWRADQAVVLVGQINAITLKQANALCRLFQKTQFIWGWTKGDPIPDNAVLFVDYFTDFDALGTGDWIPVDMALTAVVLADPVSDLARVTGLTEAQIAGDLGAIDYSTRRAAS